MKNQLFDYDDSSIESVLEYSQHLLNKPFLEIINSYKKSAYKTYEDFQTKTISKVSNKEISMKSKGQYGNYIEKIFLWIPAK